MSTSAASTTRIRALGRRLRVAQWNAIDAPAGALPLLMFNGIGMNVELIEPLALALAPRRVVSFDMPGVGASPDPVLPYNAVSMAMTASVVLDRLAIARADVIGISWGGGIAQQFAIQHRPRVGRLILAATSAGMIMAPGDPAAMSRFADPAEYTIGKAMHRTLASMTNGGGGGPPVSLNAATPPSPAGWMHQLGALFGWSSVPLLPLIDVPTLVLSGADDHIVPPLNSRFLHAMIPNSRLRLIPGAGHLAVLSHTAAVAEAVNAFLGSAKTVESA